MIDKLQKAAEYGQTLGATYVELRAESSTQSNTQYEDGRVRGISQRIEEGVAIRVLANGTWGFVSASDLSSDKLKKSVKDAYSLAKSASKSRKDPITLADIKAVHDTVPIKFEQNPTEVDPQDKINYFDTLWKECQRLDSRISAITIRQQDGIGTKYIVTNEGTQLELGCGHVYLFVRLTGKENSHLTGARNAFGSTAQGWEIYEKKYTPSMVAEHMTALVQKQLDGVTPKPGSFTCVLGPHVVGTLAHEALGHLAEADLFLQSAFAGKVGLEVAPKGVTMIDDGTLTGAIGSSKYDDEGVLTSRVEIIKDGLLNALLTNREYAMKTESQTSGSARAQDYRFMPIIRMRNTFFDRGDWKDEELFEGIDFGYYCLIVGGGQAEMNASFQVGIQEAYEIVNGEIGNSVTNMSISGIATDALFKIEGVGNGAFDFEVGRCGKGQAAFVSDGGPLIRFGNGSITFGGKD
ncbi:MAG: metallopeptidase TldD-related protein [Candidatus Hodarchaeota archaeon]